ncbi:hypothetical protein DENSPDRAFT_847482 [Dentipellis sp. KUC8613]|nr:hypothetical protein DENSPDRAFT_847482 [Dentipellis sp. KUC8613]
MSSKRGRKRNDSLPPNRARDVQRAFRARRAAHLEALEQRVAELEEENTTLRAALNLPPANRPPLGKGPTGKDKPKAFSAASGSRSQAAAALPTSTSRDGSSAGESPSPTRTHSLSPSTITATMRPSPHSVHGLEGTWDQPMIMGEEQPESHASSPSTGYPLAGVAAHKPPPHHYSYPPSMPSTSRSVPSSLYMPPVPQSAQNYAHTADRPMAEGPYSASYAVRDSRDDPQAFSYTQHTSYSSPDASQMHHASPPTPHMLPSMHREPPPAPPTMHYAQRRTIPEPPNYRNTMVDQQQYQLPSVTQMQAAAQRRPSPPRMSDPHLHLRTPYSSGGGGGGGGGGETYGRET